MRYSCVWPKKLIISQADLVSQLEVNVKPNITTTCQATGSFDIDITTYTCTKSCPLPKIPDPISMTHNWTNTNKIPEFKDKLVFSCKFGQKFISKPDFLLGSNKNLLTNITSMCQISGRFNDSSIGNYLCTRNCGPPTDYSVIMKNDWNSRMHVVSFDTTFRYFFVHLKYVRKQKTNQASKFTIMYPMIIYIFSLVIL